MNILQVYQVFSPEVSSGAAKVAYDISKSLVERGHNVVFYASDMKDWSTRGVCGNFMSDGIRIRRFKTIGTIFSRKLKIYITPSLIKSNNEISKFDIIHLHGHISFQSIVIHHYARKHGVPYVLHAHGSIPRIGKRFRKWLYDVAFGYRILRDASKVIALSEIEVKEYEQVGVPGEKIAIIPNGLDFTEYRNIPPRSHFRKRLGIQENRKIILFIGRINPLKGLDFLIEAFACLVKNSKYDALLVIAGPDDGYLKEAKQLVKERDIENAVLFVGPLFGMRKLEGYAGASVVVSLDSLKEVVFLLVPLEAAACETPVIVTKGNYIAKIVEKGEFGSSVEYGNVPELVQAFRRLLDDERSLRKMGLDGRNFVLRNFDWKNKVDKLVNVYEDTVR